ncbi:unannotated protein [freshwater metagenome]|uniref:Unannotated protein n=1 Tax=freshwater metagenome TaxID=449393 RepID=A0A6J6DD53_9ZZZZ
MTFGCDLGCIETIADLQLRKSTFGVVIVFRIGVVGSPVFDLHPAAFSNDCARRRELCIAAACSERTKSNGDGFANGIDHLRRNSALPDDFVKASFARRNLVANFFRTTETIASGTNRFVCFLRIRSLLAPRARLAFNRRGAISLGDFILGGGNCCGRKTR